MAKVPNYTPSVAERPALQSEITVRAGGDDFGAAIGRGMQSLGQGVQRVSDNVEQLNALQAQADAKDRINQLAEWQMQAAYGENGYLTTMGRTAMDGYDNYLAALKKQRSEFSRNLSPAAQAIYDQASMSRLQSATQSALIHRGTETKRWMVQTSTDRQSMLANEALVNAGNDNKVNTSILLGANEVREQGALLGWDETTTRLKVMEYESGAHSDVALRIAQQDPIAAVEYLSRNSGKLTALDQMNLVDKLAPMVADAAARDAVTMGSTPLVAPGSASDLIAGFEGLSFAAYNDPATDENGQQVGPNVYRAGYGSSTTTRADGTVVAVNPSTIVTEADAKRDLDRRIAEEFLPRAIEAVGVEAWSRLDGSTTNALLSVVYNFGHMPNSVARAVVTGDRMAIASAIEALAPLNGGLNADRRRKEAALVRNGLGAGVVFSERVEAVLQSLPADLSVQIRETAADEIGRERAAEASARNAASAAAKDTLALAIATGQLKSEQEILQHPLLDDGDKAALVNTFKSAQGATAEARSYLEALDAGTARALNPYYSDDRSMANKAFEMQMASLPAEQRKAAALDFVRESGIIPDQMIAAVRHDLNSTDGRAVAAALEQSAVLMIAAPQAVAHLDNAQEIEEAAATYTALIDQRGMSIEEAAAYVMEMRKPENKRDAELLKPAWDQAVRDRRLTINDVLNHFGDNWGPGGPIAGVTPLQQEQLQAAYLEAAERSFKGNANGDLAIAKATALAEMSRTFGISTVSGQQVVMAHPPEAYYPAVGGNHDYLRQMAMADARSVAPETVNVELIAAPQTLQDVRGNKPPRYDLIYTLPDGTREMLSGMFVVDTDQLQQLATLDTEERRLRFEIERAYKSALSDRPMDFTRRYIEKMSGGLVGPPTPAEVVPGFADLDAQLTDIGLRRDALLGQTGSLGSAIPMVDPADAEAAWLEQQSRTFGPMGGGVAP